MRILMLLLCALHLPIMASDSIIDKVLEQRAQSKQKIPWPISDDPTFLRRVWLDLAGMNPPRDIYGNWVNLPQPWDRDAIIQEVLDHESHNLRWASFLGDVLALSVNTRSGFAARDAMHEYLIQSVEKDHSWKNMAEEILTWSGKISSEHSKFSFWDAAIGEPITRLDSLDDQVDFITDKMLGIRTRCISCHDGLYHLETLNVYLSTRQRTDLWGMAAFLASSATYCDPECPPEHPQTYLTPANFHSLDESESFREEGVILVARGQFNEGEYVAQSETGDGMRPTRNGGVIEPNYLFGGGGLLPGETRREALARMIVNDRQFARNMVNRTWKHFFGQGFVEPVFNFDLARLDAQVAESFDTTVQPSDPEMLEILTDLFIQSGYSFRALITDIVSSELYQLDLERLPENPVAQKAYFGGRTRLRRLEPQAIMEIMAEVTGVRRALKISYPVKTVDRYWALPDTREPVFDDDMRNLLEDLGRGDRTSSKADMAILSQNACLALLNSPLILNDFIRNSPKLGSLAQQLESGATDPEGAISRLYMEMLLREPTQTELDRLVAHLTETEAKEGVEDIVWNLLNSPDFLFR